MKQKNDSDFRMLAGMHGVEINESDSPFSHSGDRFYCA